MIFGRCGLGDDGDGEYAIGSGSDSGYSGGGYSSVYDEIGSDANTIVGYDTPDTTTLTNVYTPPSDASELAAATNSPVTYPVSQGSIDLQPTMAQLTAPTAAAGTAATNLANSQAVLAALAAAGGSAAQIATAQSNVTRAQAAYNAAVAAPATTAACSKTLFPSSGMCDSTLYMVAAACGLLLMVGLMSGNAPPARR